MNERLWAVGIGILVVAVCGLLYFVATVNSEFREGCWKAGGVPIVAQGARMCLHPSVVIQP